ncbi:hypothetical protein SRABI133_04936 [Peribacillus simplex]|uniref:Uncharacterized protein n=1 Tax=Peribacillus simplex TaxID=1478 RepID=A0A9W4L4Q7_9BACI|nr:hypothetical protein SRABI133_04936 [Peribacillus simplex]
MTSLGMGPAAVVERIDIGDNLDGDVHWHPFVGFLDTAPSLPAHKFQVTPYYSRNPPHPHRQSGNNAEGSFDCMKKAIRLVTHNLVAYMNLLLELVDSSLHNNGAEPVRRLDMDNVADLFHSCSPLGRILDPFACQEILPKHQSSLPSFDNLAFPEPPDTLVRLDMVLACAYAPMVAAEYNNRFQARLALLEYNHSPAHYIPVLAVQLAFSSSF